MKGWWRETETKREVWRVEREEERRKNRDREGGNKREREGEEREGLLRTSQVNSITAVVGETLFGYSKGKLKLHIPCN